MGVFSGIVVLTEPVGNELVSVDCGNELLDEGLPVEVLLDEELPDEGLLDEGALVVVESVL